MQKKKGTCMWSKLAKPGALVLIGVLSAVVAETSTSAIAAEDASTAPSALKRLTAAQFRNSIEDIFGSTIRIGGRLDSDLRKDGLLAVGASTVSVTATGLERYDSIAHAIAGQIVDEKNRDTLFGCKPATVTAADESCARAFLSQVGRLLYRRNLTEEELGVRVQLAGEAAQQLNNFYSGIALSLAGMLSSPNMLFRQLETEPDPAQAGKYRLTGYSKAAQLSFFLWNSAPDPALLSAAEKGELHTDKGIKQQLDRMLNSPRLERGVRAFFFDMLHFDAFETLSKDAELYPKFTAKVPAAAQEQTLRTIVDVLLTQEGDYRDIFTTPVTYLNRSLGALYGVPVVSDLPNGAPDVWQRHVYADGDARAGILMHASFLALHSHPGRSSPTLRGKAVREVFLCQKVPEPPGNIDFTVVQDTTNPLYNTARERLSAHANEPMCKGCHKIVDPIGLAMENFDAAAGYRTSENKQPIDAAGELDGVAYRDAAGLSKAVHDNPAATTCAVNKLVSYATGAPVPRNSVAAKAIHAEFSKNAFQWKAILSAIVTSQLLFQAPAPSQEQQAQVAGSPKREEIPGEAK